VVAFKDWLKRFFTRAASSDGGTIAAASLFGPTTGFPFSSVDPNDASAYGVNAWVHACINAIAGAVSQGRLVVEEQSKGEWHTIGDHELVRLLERVNSNTDQCSLLEQTAAWLALTGNSYWQLLSASKRSKPSSIAVLPAYAVSPVRSKGIVSYEILSTSGKVTLDANEIIHFRRFSPFGGDQGMSPIRVLETIINTDTAALRFNYAFLRGGGVPAVLLTTEQVLSDEEAHRVQEMWERWAHSSRHTQRPIVLGKGVTAQLTGASPDSTFIVDLPKQLREAICAVFQVPPAIVGIYEYANYANTREQIRLFYAGTVSRYWRIIEAGINEQLAPLWGDNIRVRVDTSHIDALQPDWVQMAQVGSALTGGVPIMTVNEVREKLLGLEPLPDEWGETWWGSAMQVPLASGTGESLPSSQQAPQVPSQSPNLQPQQDKKTSSEADQQAQRDYTIRVVRVGAVPPHRANAWRKAALQRRERYEAALRSPVEEWYDELGQRMVEKLDQVVQRGLFTRVTVPSPEVILFDVDEAAELLEEKLGPAFIDVLEDAGNTTLREIGGGGIGISFDLMRPGVKDILLARTVHMKTIAENAQQACRESLLEGLANGETVEQLTDRVREWALEGKEKHAETVARTEAGSAMNGATFEAFDMAGASAKQWLTCGDDRVRDTHAEMEGVVVGIDEEFVLPSGDTCMYPGDDSLPPEEVCNCRCTLLPVFEGETSDELSLGQEEE